jgi:dienelactone hydrolase
MYENPTQKEQNEHLRDINQKFEELDALVYDYLRYTRSRGGTLGFCIGGLLQKLRDTRAAINSMCGKLKPYVYKKDSDLP